MHENIIPLNVRAVEWLQGANVGTIEPYAAYLAELRTRFPDAALRQEMTCEREAWEAGYKRGWADRLRRKRPNYNADIENGIANWRDFRVGYERGWYTRQAELFAPAIPVKPE